MAGRQEPQILFSGNGFNTPICEDDLDDEEQLPYHKFNHDKQQASIFGMHLPRYFRPAALLLGLLAAILLMVNIGLGVYYKSLTDTHLSLDDTNKISIEIKALKYTYHAAFGKMNQAKKNQDIELILQKQTQWEFEHQTERAQDVQKQIDKVTQEMAKLRSHLPLIGAGCKYCPAGWILLNSVCFYFPFSDNIVAKSWQKSRQYCKMYGGDLAVLDSKDKQNATVTYLANQYDEYKTSNGFWIGLKSVQSERTWKWLEGAELNEGYWDNGEPDGDFNSFCASVYPVANFFKSWKDNSCGGNRKWICEKTPDTIL